MHDRSLDGDGEEACFGPPFGVQPTSSRADNETKESQQNASSMSQAPSPNLGLGRAFGGLGLRPLR